MSIAFGTPEGPAPVKEAVPEKAQARETEPEKDQTQETAPKKKKRTKSQKD